MGKVNRIKKACAPIIYLLLQLTITIILNYNCQCLFDKYDQTLIILYIVQLVVGLLYLNLWLGNPGIVRPLQDNVKSGSVISNINSNIQNLDLPTLQTVNPRSERPFSRKQIKGEHQIDLECEASLNDIEPQSPVEKIQSFQCNQIIETKKIHSSSPRNPSNNQNLFSSVPTRKELPLYFLHQRYQISPSIVNKLDETSQNTPCYGTPKNNLQNMRTCQECNLAQLLRSKHCYKCGFCIAMYDHHCPWIANCIGEYNKGRFMLFLVFQILEFSIVLIKVFENLHVVRGQTSVFEACLVVISLMVLLFFSLMVVILLSYHLYIAAKNMTTCKFNTLKFRGAHFLINLNQRAHHSRGG